MKKLYLLMFFLLNFVVQWNEKGVCIETGMCVYAFFGGETGDDVDGGCLFCDDSIVITPDPDPDPYPEPCPGCGGYFSCICGQESEPEPESCDDPCACWGDCGEEEPNPPPTEDPSVSEEQQKVNDAVNELNRLLAKWFGDNVPKCPISIYIGNPFDLDKPGAFMARVLADGTIQFSQIWAEMRTAGDQISVVLHEYHHLNNDLPVARDASGEFFSIVTDIPKYSQDQIQNMIEECRKEAEKYSNGNIEFFINLCLGDITEPWTYIPSNYFQNEINAYQSELNAAAQGDYILSEEYRQYIEDRIVENIEKRDRSEEYENQNGLNTDGTNK